MVFILPRTVPTELQIQMQRRPQVVVEPVGEEKNVLTDAYVIKRTLFL
jgi:hypothetical protein